MDLFGEPEAPEPDELEEFDAPFIEEAGEFFAHPRLSLGALGHENIENHIHEMFKNGRLHHGLIFSGPKGIGKATTAYKLARFILKYGSIDPNETDMFGDAPVLPDTLDVPFEDRVFSLVASEGHPDLLTIARAYDAGKDKTAASVAVADIRRVNPFLHMTASDGGWRVVIIDDADTMNRSAQNALLKILEEPPAKTLLILVAHRVGALIPTIRSRTQTLSFTAPSKDIFADLLRRYDRAIDPAHIDTLYAMTKGSFGEAIQLMDGGALETLADIMALLRSAPAWDWTGVHKLGNELGKGAKEGAYENFTHLLQWMLADMTTSKARGRELSSPILAQPAIESWIRQSSLEKLLETCDNLSEHFLKVDRANLDKKQAVLRAFSILAA